MSAVSHPKRVWGRRVSRGPGPWSPVISHHERHGRVSRAWIRGLPHDRRPWATTGPKLVILTPSQLAPIALMIGDHGPKRATRTRQLVEIGDHAKATPNRRPWERRDLWSLMVSDDERNWGPLGLGAVPWRRLSWSPILSEIGDIGPGRVSRARAGALPHSLRSERNWATGDRITRFRDYVWSVTPTRLQ